MHSNVTLIRLAIAAESKVKELRLLVPMSWQYSEKANKKLLEAEHTLRSIVDCIANPETAPKAA